MKSASATGLDIEDAPALLDYLRQRGAIGPDEGALIRNLPGGVSNRVVLVQLENGRPFVLKQALEKLRVQVDWFCTPTRIEREALGLKYLEQLAPPGSIPGLLFEDREQHLLAMEAVPEPHENWKRMLLDRRVSSEHVAAFGHLLGSIHSKSAERSAELAKVFEDRSIYEALRIEAYYRYTASQVPESFEFLSNLIDDALQTRLTLVHGDYSPKNILVSENRLILLDFEVIHFGDPAFDIGFSMAHFLSKANHLEANRQAFIDAANQYWSVYCESLGQQNLLDHQLERRAARYTLACCLARVAGRSPLEYLTANEKARQQNAVLSLIDKPPERMPDLISTFTGRL
jgi:5-methylthioribose kinase